MSSCFISKYRVNENNIKKIYMNKFEYLIAESRVFFLFESAEGGSLFELGVWSAGEPPVPIRFLFNTYCSPCRRGK